MFTLNPKSSTPQIKILVATRRLDLRKNQERWANLGRGDIVATGTAGSNANGLGGENEGKDKGEHRRDSETREGKNQ
jgi:hypothetical protein